MSSKTIRKRQLKRQHGARKQKKRLKKRRERNEVAPLINEVRQEAKAITKKGKEAGVITRLIRSLQGAVKEKEKE